MNLLVKFAAGLAGLYVLVFASLPLMGEVRPGVGQDQAIL